MTPEQIHAQDLFPLGFLPLPHANHPEGGIPQAAPERSGMAEQSCSILCRVQPRHLTVVRAALLCRSEPLLWCAQVTNIAILVQQPEICVKYESG
jgi:hypothetical protein